MKADRCLAPLYYGPLVCSIFSKGADTPHPSHVMASAAKPSLGALEQLEYMPPEKVHQVGFEVAM